MRNSYEYGDPFRRSVFCSLGSKSSGRGDRGVPDRRPGHERHRGAAGPGDRRPRRQHPAGVARAAEAARRASGRARPAGVATKTPGSRPGVLVQTPSGLWLAWRARALEGVPVLRDIGLPLRWRVFLREDRRHRALRLARAAVDALVGVDVELVLALVYAVHRTNVHAGSVFDVDE